MASFGKFISISRVFGSKSKSKSPRNAIVLVAGTTVGAGILALPAVTQPAGFIPSTLALTGAWMYMATTGLLAVFKSQF